MKKNIIMNNEIGINELEKKQKNIQLKENNTENIIINKIEKKSEDIKWEEFKRKHGMPENLKKEDCISSKDINDYDFDYLL